MVPPALRLAFLVWVWLSPALFLASCSSREFHTESAVLRTGTTDVLAAAESALALVANELWYLGGPIGPGAFVNPGCVETRCTHENGSEGLWVIYTKSSKGCASGTAVIDGSSTMRVRGPGSLAGCATESGPPLFSAWPPRQARIEIEVGGPIAAPPPELDPTNGETAAVRRRGLQRADRRRDQTGQSLGEIVITFNGTPTAAVSFKLEVGIKEGATAAARNHVFEAGQGSLALHMPAYGDHSPRVFNGTIAVSPGPGAPATPLSVENLVFEKRSCCHPLYGRILLGPDERGQTSELRFSGACGKARMSWPPAMTRNVLLNGCPM